MEASETLNPRSGFSPLLLYRFSRFILEKWKLHYIRHPLSVGSPSNNVMKMNWKALYLWRNTYLGHGPLTCGKKKMNSDLKVIYFGYFIIIAIIITSAVY